MASHQVCHFHKFSIQTVYACVEGGMFLRSSRVLRKTELMYVGYYKKGTRNAFSNILGHLRLADCHVVPGLHLGACILKILRMHNTPPVCLQ